MANDTTNLGTRDSSLNVGGGAGAFPPPKDSQYSSTIGGAAVLLQGSSMGNASGPRGVSGGGLSGGPYPQ
jgi:hypothetical protein